MPRSAGSRGAGPSTAAQPPARVRGNRALAVGAVVLLALGGFHLVKTAAPGLSGPAAAVPPPLPPISAAHALPVPQTAAAQSRQAGQAAVFAAPLSYAVPTRITVARVGIDAVLIKVGLARNGTIGVPPL